MDINEKTALTKELNLELMRYIIALFPEWLRPPEMDDEVKSFLTRAFELGQERPDFCKLYEERSIVDKRLAVYCQVLYDLEDDFMAVHEEDAFSVIHSDEYMMPLCFLSWVHGAYGFGLAGYLPSCHNAKKGVDLDSPIRIYHGMIHRHSNTRAQ